MDPATAGAEGLGDAGFAAAVTGGVEVVDATGGVAGAAFTGVAGGGTGAAVTGEEWPRSDAEVTWLFPLELDPVGQSKMPIRITTVPKPTTITRGDRHQIACP